MQELFIEIFSEEIPARFQQPGKRQLFDIVERFFAELKLSAPVKILTDCSPNRLILLVKNLPSATQDTFEEIRGPRITAKEQAIQGFLRKYKADKSDLETRQDFYYFQNKIKGQSSEELAKQLFDHMMSKFTWPKSMRWAQSGDKTWVRPIRSIIALLGNTVVEVSYAGINAGAYSYGARDGIERKKFSVTSYDDYLEKLKVNNSIPGFEDKREMVLSSVKGFEKEYGIKLIEDDGLLSEILGLVEYPAPMLGKIYDRHMSLPFEVLQSAIKSHQKYMMFKNADGSVSNYFMVVADGCAKDAQKVLGGNHKVLNARLSDAEFFYNNDLQKPLLDKTEALKKQMFHSKIGSIYDKIQRVKGILLNVAPYFNIGDEQDTILAADLCKCDLVSEMVFEFPELQGLMGYYYATAQGVASDVALAIRDHYKPEGPNDSIPQNKLGAALAVSDKLDSLIELFKIGIKPTGSKDAFAQRRAAIGIMRILHEFNVDLPLREFVSDQSLLEFLNARKPGEKGKQL